MDRRKFATRLSIFAAAFVPAVVRGQQPRSNQPRITVPGNREQPPAQTTIIDIHKPTYGEGRNKTEAGIYGVNFHGGDGVDGQTDGGNGVHGSANTGNGVFGESTKGYGVKGSGDTGVYGVGINRGVYGEVSGGNSPAGTPLAKKRAAIEGYAPPSSINGVDVIGAPLAGKFTGRVEINDSLSVVGPAVFSSVVTFNLTASKVTKSGGSFKIDHPLAPDKKYLSHSFVESPDMMNVYNGNVTTDANGDAAIMLPAYFAALNRDCRYQLTVIGQFAQAIVASKTKDNRFTIKTDKPNVEVSWQVTGIRQDAWANAHRIQVEEDKPAKEVGSYLHPELFGQPAEKSASFLTARTDS